MRLALEKSARHYADGQIGCELKTLWEAAEPQDGGWLVRGLTDNYLPVTAQAGSDRSNQIDWVRIDGYKKGSLCATISG